MQARLNPANIISQRYLTKLVEARGAPVRTGVLFFASTAVKKRRVERPKPPSRAKAYNIRELDVTAKVPQKNIAPMTMTYGFYR